MSIEEEFLKFGPELVVDCIDNIAIQYADKINLDVIRPPFKDINNITTDLDRFIHTMYRNRIIQALGYGRMAIGGEESGQDQEAGDIRAEIDSVDGTDLVIRGFHNWGTAVYVYHLNSHLITSLVGVPTDAVYHIKQPGVKSGVCYYTKGEKAFKKQRIKGQERAKPTPLKVPKENVEKKIEDATICFYGQKPANLLRFVENGGVVSLFERLERESKNTAVRFRIYNLGGNPMLIRVAEGTVDAVIELKGQKTYDFIPGAYIAQKAGAFWGDLNRVEITQEYLRDNGFLTPEPKRLSYIVASSERLYNEILDIITESDRNKGK